MRSGVALSTIREEVMLEAGLSAQTGHNTGQIKKINQMINRMERTMILEHEWPTLHFEETLTVAADTQVINLPTNINFTMIDTVHVAYGDEWLPVKHGIGARERTIYNSTQRAMPISRYEVSANNVGQMEVWPIGGAEQSLMVQGTKTVGAMAEETDTCSVDADVLVLRVAAEILGRENKADAELKLSSAIKLTDAILKRQGASKRENLNLGARRGRNWRPGIDYIPPGG